MAKVNNQQVIQKLVDELKLYPGKDVIPSEVAEKILPVFTINSQDINVTVQPVNIIAHGVREATVGTTTIYTVPSSGKFFLTNATMQIRGNSAGFDIDLKVTPKDGSATEIFQYLSAAADNTSETINFNNPIELEPGSTITMETAGTNGYAYASIFGYTE